jgi:tRNA threonylcarbamoyladenosine modification (KEOPS) complex  Pcc1 subunit
VHRGVNFNAQTDDTARFIYRQGQAALRAKGYPASMVKLERELGDGTWIEIRLED